MAPPARLRIPIAAGTGVGIVAWLVGYAVVAAVTIQGIDAEFRRLGLRPLVAESADWQLVGWLFYNAHGVPLRFPEFGGGLGGGTHNFLTGAGGGTLLVAVPPIVLLVAGGLLTWRFRASLRSRTDAAILGATTAVGYLLATIIGLLVVAVSVSEVTIRPDPVTAIVLAGLAYPIGFGALGGLLVRAVAT